MKKILFIAIVVIVVLLALCWRGCRHKAAKQQVFYRTALIGRSTITQDVSASGTVQPIQEVEVGTQVTGSILELKVDYNSVVKEGDVIAKIDPATYQATYDATTAQVNSAKAAVESAKAQLMTAQANLNVSETKLKFSRRELERVIKLHDKKMLSDAEYDNQASECEQIEAQIESNKAAIAAAKAAIGQAEASVMQHEASQRQALANLNYCTITSPVNGIVLSRDVDEGQTVVSNMSASTLFTIATDLSRIQVEASVPEADIGQVAKGQKVVFTVDAYKNSFIGTVKDIRLDAKTESNVVTYPVIVEADNPGEKLFPGMTANLSIIVVEKSNVLSVPAAAIRYKGPAATATAAARKPIGAPPQGGNAMPSNGLPNEPFPPASRPMQDFVSTKTIWLLDESQKPQPVEVRLGATDGVNQEIIADIPLEGKSVITSSLSAAEAQKNGNKTTNPFAPKPPKRAPAGQPPR